ncbi:MAG: hypothetical protein ACLTJG_10730 [[Clostridium] innocuum]
MYTFIIWKRLRKFVVASSSSTRETIAAFNEELKAGIMMKEKIEVAGEAAGAAGTGYSGYAMCSPASTMPMFCRLSLLKENAPGQSAGLLHMGRIPMARCIPSSRPK